MVILCMQLKKSIFNPKACLTERMRVIKLLKSFILASSSNVNGHAGVDDDPANLLLSNKTKLQHLSEEEREHLNRSALSSG